MATPVLRPDHDICGFVMAGFFCRLLMFRCFGQNRFVNMIFCFLDLAWKVFKDFPGNLELLFYYKQYFSKNFILTGYQILEFR